jgi:hypothetical protein
MFNLDKINKYLKNPNLEESVFVDDKSSIHFHWSNHKITKQIAQRRINLSPIKNRKNLWIKNKESYLKLDKQEITDYIASNNLKDDNLFDVKMIANCLSEEFEDSCLADHIDETELRKSYFRMALKNKIPQRSFRLSTKEEILFCYSNNFLQETKVVIHQFSNSGILFKCSNVDFLEIFEENKTFKIYLDSAALTRNGKAYTESEKNAIILKKENIKICDQFIDENNYFYVRYADMNGSEIKSDLCLYLNSFEQNVIKKIA